MVAKKLTNQEVVQKGKRIYDESLRERLERDHLGQFVVVDVLSGDYEIGIDDADATLRILRRRPDAFLYGVRIGDDVAYHFGIGKVRTR